MAVVLVYWCFHCYGVNPRPDGRCGQSVAPPSGTTEVDRLAWALRHPDGDRALLAARSLGRRHDRSAVAALRAAVDDPSDPFVAAEALRSLVALEGSETLRGWLHHLAATAPFLVREVATEALEGEA